ncbi:hypothetical protein AB0D59_42175 [Streptomyces sp. NPDC048417]
MRRLTDEEGQKLQQIVRRRERARIRSEKGIHWGGRPLKAAA